MQRLCVSLAVLALMSGLRLPAAEDGYPRAIAALRATRVDRLTTPDGWLSLVGLHFLNPGANRIGRANDNDIVLAAGPAHFGTATLTDEGRVVFAPAAGVAATIDGQPAREAAELRPVLGATKPPLVAAGTVSFFVIERGGKKALRVKDSASPRRAHFVGLEYFPIDPGWRIEARWEPFERSRQIPITNVLGQTSPGIVPGRAVFEHAGKTWELVPLDEGPGEPLFFVFSDATSGRETYGASRFLYAARPPEGARTITLDFNLAENPPCAFTPFATCPLPPKENRLPFAVTAGEKDYRGAHD